MFFETMYEITLPIAFVLYTPQLDADGVGWLKLKEQYSGRSMTSERGAAGAHQEIPSS